MWRKIHISNKTVNWLCIFIPLWAQNTVRRSAWNMKIHESKKLKGGGLLLTLLWTSNCNKGTIYVWIKRISTAWPQQLITGWLSMQYVANLGGRLIVHFSEGLRWLIKVPCVPQARIGPDYTPQSHKMTRRRRWQTRHPNVKPKSSRHRNVNMVLDCPDMHTHIVGDVCGRGTMGCTIFEGNRAGAVDSHAFAKSVVKRKS